MAAYRVKKHGLQLPYIAWKGIGLQQRDQFFGHGRLFLAQGACCLVKKEVNQEREVARSVTERGDIDVVGSQSEIEVLTESAAFLQVPEVLVGYCNTGPEAYIHLPATTARV
jgi:hypothetical protein